MRVLRSARGRQRPGLRAAVADGELARRVAARDGGRPAAEARAVPPGSAPRVRLYGLRHLRDAAAADDLVQEVLVLTLERLRAGRVREPDRLASFVLGACRLVGPEPAARRAAPRGAARPLPRPSSRGRPSPTPSRSTRPAARLPRAPGRARAERPRADLLRRAALGEIAARLGPEPRQRAHRAPPGVRPPARCVKGARVSALPIAAVRRGCCSTGGRASCRGAERPVSRSTSSPARRARPAPSGSSADRRGVAGRSCGAATCRRSCWPAGRRAAAARGAADPRVPVPPGGGVLCTVGPDDDVVLARLVGDLRRRGATRPRLADRRRGRAPVARPPVRPRPPERSSWPRRSTRCAARPAHVERMRLVAVEPEGDRLLGEYTFDHSPWSDTSV